MFIYFCWIVELKQKIINNKKLESFGWILLNLEFICVIGTVPSYLGNWGKKVNFGNGVAEIQQKYERKRKSGREKFLNFGNHITEIPAAQTCWSKTNCGNDIAEIGEKKFVAFVAIVAMPLPKMGGKK